MEKIAVFNVSLDEGTRTFEIYSEGFNLDIDQYDTYLDSEQEEIYLVGSDGTREPFEVVATTWIGHRLTSYDALGTAVSAYFNGNPAYEFLEIAPDIEQMAASVVSPVCSVAGNDAYESYFAFENGKRYHLSFVTDTCVFYTCYEDVVFLSAETMELLSDNYFAENALVEAVERTMNGEENVIWENEDEIPYIRNDIAEQN